MCELEIKRHGDRVLRSIPSSSTSARGNQIIVGCTWVLRQTSRFLCNGVLQQWRGNSHNAESVLEVWVILCTVGGR